MSWPFNNTKAAGHTPLHKELERYDGNLPIKPLPVSTPQPKPAPIQSSGTALTEPPEIVTFSDEKHGLTALSTMSSRLKQHLATRARVGSGAKGQKGTVVKFVQFQTLTGSPNTVFFPVVTATAVGTQDYSSFAAVYDEARVLRIALHSQMQSSAMVATLGASWAAAWDPGNSGAYSQVADVLTAMLHIGPVSAVNSVGIGPSTTGLMASPLQFTKTGFHVLKVSKLEKPVLLSNGTSLTPLVGGGWYATADTSGTVGYFKFGVSPLGSGTTATISAVAIYDVEFRSRT